MVHRKTMLPYLLLLLLAHAGWVTTADLENYSLVKNIFILAGQSNISGRGGVINHSLRPGFVNESWDGVIPRECESNPSILRLSGGLKWVEAHEPLHKDIDVNNTCGIGPGMPFANTVLKKDPSIGVIGLVPCAVGGTSITEWAPGGFLYKNMIKRTKAATRGGGKIRALLWFQGESDAKTLEDAKMYKVRLERFFKNVRHDLELPNLTVIQVGIATALGPYMELVREAQREINIGNLKYVDAKGLQIGPDYTHLTTAAQIQLGQMLADAFLRPN
ncbi:probable carbohydrate esterase At4g34215 [Solanum verrucosum]|uniref:probable carbohydrate esterase At4g34215 n=1 Tax=Solanum verrucosum TaxID=315347 RepID=UPI0020D1C04A|nr:probable carbohydrate esterase At4g34215 [Solanum verrucosum]